VKVQPRQTEKSTNRIGNLFLVLLKKLDSLGVLIKWLKLRVILNELESSRLILAE